MRRQQMLVSAGRGAAATALVLATLSACSGSVDEGPAADGATEVVPGEGIPMVLYFPAASGQLEAETRFAPAELAPAERRRWLAEQLAAGPTRDDLAGPLPPETTVAGVFAAPDGTVYADFTIAEELPGMGSTEELLALYSIVNTLVLEDEAHQKLVLLFNGRQRESLGGHVDTTQPLAARPELIREAG